ncbi:MAG: hypothetical protein DGJ47_000417 [Rickettsiaceae bacterium]
MKLPFGFYDKLRDTVRVSEIVGKRVSLTKKGGEHSGLCPFHNEKTPSFTVNDSKKFYHCFGCGAHGDLIRFISETQGFSYKDAAIQIAQDNGIEIPKVTAEEERKYEFADRVKHLLEIANEFFVNHLNVQIKNYLEQRGIKQTTIKDFAIGYAPSGNELEKMLYEKGFSEPEILQSGLFGKRDSGRVYPIFNSRIMFPIKNSFSKIVAFGGRAVGEAMPKYINSPETMLFKKSEIMFGANLANKYFHKDNYAILVEGYMDVIALHQAGFHHAVASLGTSVTQSHIDKLWGSCDEIVVCLDGDEAGKRAANKIIQMILPNVSSVKSVSFIELPLSCDPDDLIQKEGADAFAYYVDNRIALSEKIWRNEYVGKNFEKAESRAALERKFHLYCSEIVDKGLQANFRRYFNDMVWNNIIRRKKGGGIHNASLSEEVRSFAKYSEIEFLEYAICAFLLYFIEFVDEESLEISLSEPKLEGFKLHLVDYLNNNDNPKFESLSVNLKNSRFSGVFELLSKQKNLFLRDIFVNKLEIDKKAFLHWLCKKHYLLILKNEYVELLRLDKASLEVRLSSYLQEINRVSVELKKLSENFLVR